MTALGTYKKSIEIARELGVPLSFESHVPWPVKDNIGFGCALEILIVLQKKSRYQSTHR